MRTQDLRDTDYERKRYLWHKRGWSNRWRWEGYVCRNPLSDPLRAVLSLGGHEPAQVQVALTLLGVGVYLTFPNLLPERWEIGWFKRGETQNPRWHEDSLGRDWGVYYFEKALVVLWGKTTAAGGRDSKKYGYSWHFYVPWSWDVAVRWDVQRPDGSWVPKAREYEPPYSDGRKVYVEPYTYKLKCGEIQSRTATFHVSEMEWRWRMFRKWRIGPKRVRRSIDIRFDGEVGERSGSWKGGCTGCGYDMLPGEDPVACLRRMERERVFE